MPLASTRDRCFPQKISQLEWLQLNFLAFVGWAELPAPYIFATGVLPLELSLIPIFTTSPFPYRLNLKSAWERNRSVAS